MNINQPVFTGIFSDEMGQRFLKIVSVATENAFKDLYDSCVPHKKKQLNECLAKVQHWDKSVINGEFEKLNCDFIDLLSCFRQIYINYVKAMRGNNRVKIMVNLPKFENFLHSYLVHMSMNSFMKEGKYFSCGPLEQKCICMEATRDSLYEYIGDENVKIEERSKVSSVVSKYSQKHPTIPEDDDGDSIGPDDSISNIGGYTSRKMGTRTGAKTGTKKLSLWHPKLSLCKKKLSL